jgi:hypothetical protein
MVGIPEVEFAVLGKTNQSITIARTLEPNAIPDPMPEITPRKAVKALNTSVIDNNI